MLAVDLGVAGAVLGIAYLTVLRFVAQSKLTDIASFGFLLGIMPIIVGAAFAWRLRLSDRQRLFGKAFVTACVAVVVILVVLQGLSSRLPRHVVDALPLYAGLITVGVFALIGRVGGRRFAGDPIKLEETVDRCLAFCFVTLLVVFSPLDRGSTIPFAAVAYVLKTPMFVVWTIAGCAFCAGIVWLLRREALLFLNHRERYVAAALVVAIVVTLSLYDDSHFIDLAHYAPYVGAAMFAHAGGVPMVDVYSVYGLMPWLLIWLGYDVLGPTLGTTAIVVRIVTIAYYLVFVVFVFALARRRVSAMILLLPALLVAVVFMPGLYSVPDMFNLNGTPSVTGMRFLPPAVLALVLAFDSRCRWVRAVAYGLLALSSLWSLETFAFSIVIWGLAVLLESVRRRDLRDAAIQVVVAIAVVAAAQAAFALLIFVAYGRVIDFKPYVDLLLVFSSIRPNQIPEFGSWAAYIADDFLWWVPVWLAVFLTIALATYGAVRRLPRGTVGRAAPMAAFCIVATSYFAGRSAPPTLGFATLPFACLVILGTEPLIVRPGRYGTIGRPAFALICGLVVLSFGFAFERFFRSAEPTQGNSTILRHCFDSWGCGPAAVAARLAAAPSAPVERPYQDMYWAAYRNDLRGRVDDLVALMKRYASDERRVALLPETRADFFSGYVALSKTGQWYKWPIGSPIIEQQSGVNVERILRAIKLRPGEPVIVAKPDLSPLGQQIFDRINANCKLAAVTETNFNTVYRVETCAPEILESAAK